VFVARKTNDRRKNMEREFLKGLELDKETIDTIMAEHGKNVQSLKDDNESLRKERDDLKTQVDNANKEIQSYKDMDIDSIKQSASDWETKYNDLIKSQEEAKKEEIKTQRVNDFFKDVKFASNSAKLGVINEFNKKEFKYDEETGKFQGASEWLEEYKKNDGGAFLSDVANPKFTTNVSSPTNSSTNDEIRKAMGLKEK